MYIYIYIYVIIYSIFKYICDNSILEISNTIEINHNNCKQFSVIKIHKDKAN